jgi:hypothetical protein
MVILKSGGREIFGAGLPHRTHSKS